MVMFMCSLAFVMDTAGEMTSNRYLRRSPLAVMRTDGADVVCVGDLGSIVYLVFFDEFYCSRSFYFSFLGLDFPTPFGRSLSHMFAFDLSQISLSGPFMSFLRDGFCWLLVE